MNTPLRRVSVGFMLLFFALLANITYVQAFQADELNARQDNRRVVLDEGQAKALREHILVVGEERFGAIEEGVPAQLANISDLDRLKRMHRRAVKAANWQEILQTP